LSSHAILLKGRSLFVWPDDLKGQYSAVFRKTSRRAPWILLTNQIIKGLRNKDSSFVWTGVENNLQVVEL
jgi:hypothetical protein